MSTIDVKSLFVSFLRREKVYHDFSKKLKEHHKVDGSGITIDYYINVKKVHPLGFFYNSFIWPNGEILKWSTLNKKWCAHYTAVVNKNAPETKFNTTEHEPK